MSYTKGPWKVRGVRGGGFFGQRGFAIDYNEDQEQVVDFVYEKNDAHLIAAAPELFEALEIALRWIEQDTISGEHSGSDNPDDYDDIRIMRAALSKARGQQ